MSRNALGRGNSSISGAIRIGRAVPYLRTSPITHSDSRRWYDTKAEVRDVAAAYQGPGKRDSGCQYTLATNRKSRAESAARAIATRASGSMIPVVCELLSLRDLHRRDRDGYGGFLFSFSVRLPRIRSHSLHWRLMNAACPKK